MPKTAGQEIFDLPQDQGFARKTILQRKVSDSPAKAKQLPNFNSNLRLSANPLMGREQNEPSQTQIF